MQQRPSAAASSCLQVSRLLLVSKKRLISAHTSLEGTTLPRCPLSFSNMIIKADPPPPYTSASGGNTATGNTSTSYPPSSGELPQSNLVSASSQLGASSPPTYQQAITERLSKRESMRDCCGTVLPTVLAISLLLFVFLGLLVFAIAIPFTLVGARILGYSTLPLTNTYTELGYSYGYRRRYAGLSGQFSRALAAGTAVIMAGLTVLGWLVIFLWALIRTDSAGHWSVALWTVVGGGCMIAAAIVPGVGVALRSVTDFSTRHAFASGAVGFAVLGGSVTVVVVCLLCLKSIRT